MNAAFLLVTTACLAGADSAPPAVAAPAPAASSSCGNCDACCEEGCLKRLLNRLKHSSCDSCDTCKPAPTCKPACAPAPKLACTTTCDSCCESGHKKLFSHSHGSSSCDTCGSTHGHKSCGSSCGCGDCGCEDGLLKRLFAKFHHKDCCDSCSSCDAAPATAPKPEQIPAPKGGEPGKKMPEGKGPKEVHVIPPQPIAPPALEVTPVTSPKTDSQS